MFSPLSVEQMEEIERNRRNSKVQLSPVEPNQIAVIAVSPGLGISRVFASLGAAGIVEGGQTMNPSTEDIIDAFENLPTEKVIILPNNKNIIMAAQSAAELTVKTVAVIPCKTIPQGLSAMFRLDPDGDFEEVKGEMLEAMEEVETGEITTAIRTTMVDDINVKEGEIIALLNGKLVLATKSLEESCLGLLNKANASQYELITLFYGADISKQEANHIADTIRATYPNLEIELQDGGQPHYQFILSIE